MANIRTVSNRNVNNAMAALSAASMPVAGAALHPAQAVPCSESRHGEPPLHRIQSQAAPGSEGALTMQNQLSPQVKSMAPFHSSIFPVLCIDNQFRIIYANQSSRKFFTGLFSLDGNLFFDVFGKYFQIQDVKAIRAAILQGVNGFSWRGIAHIKSRERPTVFTRVYIFPAQMNVKEPVYFTVMFDDVTEENKRLLRSVFMSLLEASKLKDNDTGKHISRVNYYSEVLAKGLFNRPGYDAVDAEFIDNIGFLASMHDVGKIGTPDDILNKEGALSDWEWTVMKEHTKNGAFILSTYPNPMAKEIALSHHEKWDGNGYPFQLEGTMIPLSARIVAIADVYDALRMKRSYKEALTHADAVKKIIENKGSHFDPALTDIFIAISGKFDEIYEAHKD
ncbi:MAG: HD domain-containing protein [Spirochaetaceae bacterium]|jgi:putative two-component system response regulator|nr:HD domain-containing protein [Spirochaetaceae bacterium]